MAPLRSLFAAAALLLSAASAHFQLLQPPSLEGDQMNEDLEPNAPCGGGVADLSTNEVVDFHVDGDAVGWFLGHPQANWLIRGTLDSKAAGNWTEMYPIIQQDGRGEYCQPAVKAPSSWAGNRGIISIACGAPDGLLFQCAAVNFVSGANTSPSSCNNGSATATFTEDPNLSALLDSSTATSPSPSESTSGSAAPSLIVRSGSLPIGSLAATAVMLLIGAALV